MSKFKSSRKKCHLWNRFSNQSLDRFSFRREYLLLFFALEEGWSSLASAFEFFGLSSDFFAFSVACFCFLRSSNSFLRFSRAANRPPETFFNPDLINTELIYFPGGKFPWNCMLVNFEPSSTRLYLFSDPISGLRCRPVYPYFHDCRLFFDYFYCQSDLSFGPTALCLLSSSL